MVSASPIIGTAMAALTLHYHPLSSYCQKALIAADVLGVALDKRQLNLGDAAERAAFIALWPTGKMPLLVDDGQPIPKTSILIEHLQLHHARGGRRLIPQDAAAALTVRLWDRLFDLYVMTPMQTLTADLLKPEAERDARAVAKAREALLQAYDFIERQLSGKTWAASDDFSLADCAAAPALFYALTYVPLSPQHAALAAYFERLMTHPAVARAVDEARPFFQYYPGRAGLATRFYNPAAT